MEVWEWELGELRESAGAQRSTGAGEEKVWECGGIGLRELKEMKVYYD